MTYHSIVKKMLHGNVKNPTRPKQKLGPTQTSMPPPLEYNGRSPYYAGSPIMHWCLKGRWGTRGGWTVGAPRNAGIR